VGAEQGLGHDAIGIQRWRRTLDLTERARLGLEEIGDGEVQPSLGGLPCPSS
jgi:hypothetical protein